ncbi:hypothetical protein [Streptomyces sp. 891-h]|uniref:hypothetical protein n=1 Tax=Streptomyces sp. 891-h TaxID=2720714 RepID=UPI001FA996BB|nr:hypothetical protein [Streptomyces sp. 891-h]
MLIREVARRTGRGWPSILLLSAAFGLFQAGLIDQSLFNPHFVSDPFWSQERLPTLVPAAGISAHHLLGFVVGHMIWSFAAPIVVVESCVPRLADRPWLGRVGTTVLLVLYALAVVVFFHEHTRNFMRARHNWAPPRLSATHQLAPADWSGSVLDLTALSLGGCLLLFWSRRRDWDRPHALMVGGTALVVNAALSFVVEPVGGHTSLTAKYAANATLMAAVLALLTWAYRRLLHTGARTTTATLPEQRVLTIGGDGES